MKDYYNESNSTIDNFLIKNNDLRHVVRRAFIIENFHIQKYKIILLVKIHFQ